MLKCLLQLYKQSWHLCLNSLSNVCTIHHIIGWIETNWQSNDNYHTLHIFCLHCKMYIPCPTDVHYNLQNHVEHGLCYSPCATQQEEPNESWDDSQQENKNETTPRTLGHLSLMRRSLRAALHTTLLLAVFTARLHCSRHHPLVQLSPSVVHHSCLQSLGAILRAWAGDSKRSHLSIRSCHVRAAEAR